MTFVRMKPIDKARKLIVARMRAIEDHKNNIGRKVVDGDYGYKDGRITVANQSFTIEQLYAEGNDPEYDRQKAG